MFVEQFVDSRVGVGPRYLAGHHVLSSGGDPNNRQYTDLLV